MTTQLLPTEHPAPFVAKRQSDRVCLGISSVGKHVTIGGWADAAEAPLLFSLRVVAAEHVDEDGAIKFLRSVLTGSDLYAVIERPVWSERGRTRNSDFTGNWQKLLGEFARTSRFHVVDPFSWRARLLRGFPGETDKDRATFFCADVLEVDVQGRSPEDCVAICLAYYTRWHHGIERVAEKARGGRA